MLCSFYACLHLLQSGFPEADDVVRERLTNFKKDITPNDVMEHIKPFFVELFRAVESALVEFSPESSESLALAWHNYLEHKTGRSRSLTLYERVVKAATENVGDVQSTLPYASVTQINQSLFGEGLETELLRTAQSLCDAIKNKSQPSDTQHPPPVLSYTLTRAIPWRMGISLVIAPSITFSAVS